jgi:hypothetical protein
MIGGHHSRDAVTKGVPDNRRGPTTNRPDDRRHIGRPIVQGQAPERTNAPPNPARLGEYHAKADPHNSRGQVSEVFGSTSVGWNEDDRMTIPLDSNLNGRRSCLDHVTRGRPVATHSLRSLLALAGTEFSAYPDFSRKARQGR